MSNFDDMVAREEAFGAGKAPGEQGSVEWLMERVGYCTASRFEHVMDFLKKGGEGAKRAGYRMELVIERMTGKPFDHYVNAAMEWGSANEPMAIMAYEAQTGAMVTQSGFTKHQTIALCGGSVDGLIDDDGLIEIKCPTTGTHIKTLLGTECDHLHQIHGYLWITGRAWADFVSYDPRMPQGLQLYIKRIQRDDKFIETLAGMVEDFLAEVDEQVTALHRIAAEHEVTA